MVVRGRISIPGKSIGMISQLMPLWRLSSDPVRTNNSQWSATSAWLVQIFDPVTT